jgi:hypothetical protein
MRFLVLGYLDESQPDAYAPPPEMFAAVGALSAEAQRAGVLVETHGLLPTATGARVAVVDGAASVVKGPFTGEGGTISNYTVLEVGSLDEASHWAARFATCIGQPVEIRQVM